MDCRTILLMVMSAFLMESMAIPTVGEATNDASMVELVQNLMKEIADVKNKLEKLQSRCIQVDGKEQIKQALLPGGYSNFTVEDLQWQSLHMAAAAACRASTALGGSGPIGNVVLPRTTSHTCTQVCNATSWYTHCDASLSISGVMGRVVTAKSPAGAFYNYGCDSPGYSGLAHEEAGGYDITRDMSYMGYCCCRR